METEKITWSEFPNGRKEIVEQILASEDRNKSKRAGLWESKSRIWVGKLTIWVRSFEIKKRTSCMLDEVESKTVHKDEKGDW